MCFSLIGIICVCISPLVGTGSFGTVYRAQGVLDGVMYAIKKSRRRPHNQSERTSMMHEVSPHAYRECVVCVCVFDNMWHGVVCMVGEYVRPLVFATEI